MTTLHATIISATIISTIYQHGPMSDSTLAHRCPSRHLGQAISDLIRAGILVVDCDLSERVYDLAE